MQSINHQTSRSEARRSSLADIVDGQRSVIPAEGSIVRLDTDSTIRIDLTQAQAPPHDHAMLRFNSEAVNAQMEQILSP